MVPPPACVRSWESHIIWSQWCSHFVLKFLSQLRFKSFGGEIKRTSTSVLSPCRRIILQSSPDTANQQEESGPFVFCLRKDLKAECGTTPTADQHEYAISTVPHRYIPSLKSTTPYKQTNCLEACKNLKPSTAERKKVEQIVKEQIDHDRKQQNNNGWEPTYTECPHLRRSYERRN